MKEIPLTQGFVAIVDNEDFEWLNQWNWQVHPACNGIYYASRTCRAGDGPHLIRMHRQIMNTPEGFDTDHINHNGLDNRRENLRVCTRSQNHQNRQPYTKQKSSRFKGVYWDKAAEKWMAEIKLHKKKLRLGLFTSETDAAKAYDAKATELFGEFALLNFPRG